MNEEIKITAKERVEGIFNPATENNDRGKPGKYSTHLQEIKDIRTATITQKGQICIPSVARNLAGFKEGTKISVVVFEDRVELRPLKKENFSEALLCMLASEKVLAKNWLSKEDEEAWKDL